MIRSSAAVSVNPEGTEVWGWETECGVEPRAKASWDNNAEMD